MHLIALLDTATSGRIVLDGTDMTRLSPVEVAHLRDETSGCVLQQFFLVAGSRVIDNVTLLLTVAGVG
jgi:putative ABC transport system ATP-binding protein